MNREIRTDLPVTFASSTYDSSSFQYSTASSIDANIYLLLFILHFFIFIMLLNHAVVNLLFLFFVHVY